MAAPSTFAATSAATAIRPIATSAARRRMHPVSGDSREVSNTEVMRGTATWASPDGQRRPVSQYPGPQLPVASESVARQARQQSINQDGAGDRVRPRRSRAGHPTQLRGDRHRPPSDVVDQVSERSRPTWSSNQPPPSCILLPLRTRAQLTAADLHREHVTLLNGSGDLNAGPSSHRTAWRQPVGKSTHGATNTHAEPLFAPPTA